MQLHKHIVHANCSKAHILYTYINEPKSSSYLSVGGGLVLSRIVATMSKQLETFACTLSIVFCKSALTWCVRVYLGSMLDELTHY